MTDLERFDEMRELFLEASEVGSVRFLALLLGVALFAWVLFLVRRRRLRAEYTPVWAGVALGMIVVGIHVEVLRSLARILGAWTLSSTVFFLGELFLVAIALHYAVRLSRTGTQIRELAQDLALLRRQVEDLTQAPRAPRSPDLNVR